MGEEGGSWFCAAERRDVSVGAEKCYCNCGNDDNIKYVYRAGTLV